jgi:hypothetical protein
VGLRQWHHQCYTDPVTKKLKGENNFEVVLYSFKFKGYNILMQVIIDHQKRFQAVFVSFFNSINDVPVL